MPSLDMKGPYPLTPAKVDEVVRDRSCGNFAIGYLKQDGKFVVRYVGRADSDLNAVLKQQPTDVSTKFKWSYAPNEKTAFDKHCKTWHDFGASAQLECEEHPEPPKGTNWKCPCCDFFG